ncbi:MAG: DUF362 domain-containing protein, partial [Dehalococcoidia bacterium]
MTVAVVRFDETLDSICHAIELCGGFDKLNRHSQILIKPNILFSGWMPIPLYGMVTSARVVEGVLYMLAEYGCSNIYIGEGGISGVLGSRTTVGYRRTGIQEVANKYGVQTVDLNEGPFERISIGGEKIGVANLVLESDFLINIPVLKTHSQVKVSLGLKNLKGCIDYDSRKVFHKKGLEHMIVLLNEIISCDLTIIDGIYMLEKGPDTLLGLAHRKNVIIASQDTFSCDCVGATIMGIDPAQVGYLKEYAEAYNRSTDINSMVILGENLAFLNESIDWISSVDDDLLGPAGITGLSVPHPGQGLCSSCYANLVFSLAVIAHDNHDSHVPVTTIHCGS